MTELCRLELLDQVVQHYACSNSEHIKVDTKIIVPAAKDALGFVIQEPVYRYAPPQELWLAPNLMITFDPGQRVEANGRRSRARSTFPTPEKQ